MKMSTIVYCIQSLYYFLNKRAWQPYSHSPAHNLLMYPQRFGDFHLLETHPGELLQRIVAVRHLMMFAGQLLFEQRNQTGRLRAHPDNVGGRFGQRDQHLPDVVLDVGLQNELLDVDDGQANAVGAIHVARYSVDVRLKWGKWLVAEHGEWQVVVGVLGR